jgi:hypothetical protein
MRYRPLDSGRFICRGHAEEGDTLYFTYLLCDSVLKEIREIARQRNDYQPEPSIAVFAVSWEFYTSNDRIYVHDRSKGQVIDVYDRDGRFLYAIRDDYQPVPVRHSHIDGVHDYYRDSPYSREEYEPWLKDALRFPDYFPAVRTWTVDDGRIYLFSFRQKDGKSELRIYDTHGRRLKSCYIRLDQQGTDIDRVAPYAIGQGRFYQCEQDASEKWRLRFVRLD